MSLTHLLDCAWINNCVGSKNTKYFLGFLLTSSLLCFYGFFLFSYILRSIIVDRSLFSLARMDPVTRATRPVTALDVFAYLVQTEGTFVVLTIFLFLVGVLQMVFLTYMMTFVTANVTTNEQEKWERLAAEGKEAKNVWDRGSRWANFVDVVFDR